MPNLKVHCEISERRTGENYEGLHKWMDEATEYLGANHRQSTVYAPKGT